MSEGEPGDATELADPIRLDTAQALERLEAFGAKQRADALATFRKHLKRESRWVKVIPWLYGLFATFSIAGVILSDSGVARALCLLSVATIAGSGVVSYRVWRRSRDRSRELVAKYESNELDEEQEEFIDVTLALTQLSQAVETIKLLEQRISAKHEQSQQLTQRIKESQVLAKLDEGEAEVLAGLLQAQVVDPIQRGSRSWDIKLQLGTGLLFFVLGVLVTLALQR